MIKGFIFYRDSEIPFVIDTDFRMELFSNTNILDDYCREFNLKHNYVLEGKCIIFGSTGNKIVLIVEYSLGTTCYLKCYMISNGHKYTGNNLTLSLESEVIDSIFQYKYKVIDYAREKKNLSKGKIELYAIPFRMNDKEYQLRYSIGRILELGLLEDFNRMGEGLIQCHSNDIQELYQIYVLMQRFSSFMVSTQPCLFKKVKIYEKELLAGHFWAKDIKDEPRRNYDISFHEFDVERFIPRILNNIAIDIGSSLSKSIPLGHLTESKLPCKPQRFVEQITTFEYLFEKLEHDKAVDSKFSLRSEIEFMLKRYDHISTSLKISASDIAKELKKVRIDIVHGYTYYYDFDDNHRLQYMIIILDKLLQAMSLEVMGFSEDDVADYQKALPFI